MCQIEKTEEMDCRSIPARVAGELLLSLRHPLSFMVVFLRKTRKFNFSKTQHPRKNKKLRVKGCSKKVEHVSLNLRAGDTVKVRSKEEILQTLDDKNKLEGCTFMEEMWRYCGTQQRVLKRVNYFYDEAVFQMRKARNTVLLEGLHCSGELSGFKHKCDRCCLFFWREEWLDKIK